MLSAAQRERAAGRDVLIGVVETHGRSETAALLAGLDALPLRELAYRGRTLAEFDLDAALARKPAVLLVDELAHTNAPGSRHAKRWQDVQELLAAGIEVWSALNVQHLESLNGTVGAITGVRVHETVPDTVLDEADEVVLVDVTPDELTARLAAGKVYLPQQAERAAQNFFRKGNLIALREIALRRTAEHVEDDVRGWRVEQSGAAGNGKGGAPAGLEHLGRDPRVRRSARRRGADGAHRGAARGPAQCALACGVRRDAAAAAPGRRGARPHPRGAQAGRGTGRGHRGAHRFRRGRATRRAGAPAQLRDAGAGARRAGERAGAAGGPARAVPPLRALAQRAPALDILEVGARRQRAPPVAHAAQHAARRRRRSREGAHPLARLRLGHGHQRGAHAALHAAGQRAGALEHRDAVPARRGRRGDALRARAFGAGGAAQRGGLRLFLRAAAPVVRGERRAVRADLRDHARRRPAGGAAHRGPAFCGRRVDQPRAARALAVRAHARALGRAGEHAGGHARRRRGAGPLRRPCAGAGDRRGRPARAARRAARGLRCAGGRLGLSPRPERRPGDRHAGRAALALRAAAGADARARRAGARARAAALAADSRAGAAARHAGAADRHRAGARALRRGGAAGRGRDGIGAPAQRAARRDLARRAHAAHRAHRAGRIAADAAARRARRTRRAPSSRRRTSCMRWSTTCSTWRGSKAASRAAR
jgi:hypothetical protein